MKTFPAEHELVSLFQSAPKLLDPGVPWEYNHVTFETSLDDNRVVCDIEPANEHLRIRWEEAGVELVNLDLSRVSGLAVVAERGREALVATFRDPHLKRLRFQIRPRLHLFWGTDGELA
jgi:hypothetical protein